MLPVETFKLMSFKPFPYEAEETLKKTYEQFIYEYVNRITNYVLKIFPKIATHYPMS
jgi:hypothetical protein